MKFTLEAYRKLLAEITAVQSVSYGDKTVNYRSLSDLLKLKDLMEAELFPERIQRRRVYFEFDRGYFEDF